jgi:hypothetical protein
VSANTIVRAMVSFFTSASLLMVPGSRSLKSSELAQIAITTKSRVGGFARTG